MATSSNSRRSEYVVKFIRE